MKTYITTMEELQGKPVSELHAIFRKAAEIAYAENNLPLERDTAKRTIENVKNVLRNRGAEC
ncbi:hypothetical protein [Candidatus Nitrotoga sp. AM1P]|uniref:hypothetical protein n=1 Tax=Candidatus Nitrotoga sp. AM1P TaxID=2559597 RepID=UPI0010BAAB76|nr:hypothetical protein [Candidatus Nitrotoga sp. AM1P]BBJ23055.1 hypothetical protein W01_09820 [Candidatus Nitrotoga sp. AM1P]